MLRDICSNKILPESLNKFTNKERRSEIKRRKKVIVKELRMGDKKEIADV